MKFYIFAGEKLTQSPDEQYKGKWCDAMEVDDERGPFEKCPLCGRPVSMLKWEEPRKIRLTSTKYPDYLQYWLLDSFVISERFMHAYNEADLKGISSFSKVEVVKVAHKKLWDPDPPKYYYANINFSKTIRIDTNKTVYHGQRTDWKCPVCNPLGQIINAIEHIELDASQWDGIDIFRVYGTGDFFCSEKFYEFVKLNKFTNFNLVPVDEYTWGLNV